MASTPVTQYTTIKPKDNGLNNLFERLNTMRANHLTASQNAGSNTSGITSAFATNIAVAGNNATRANVEQLKTDIDAVAASGSFTANKGSTATAITVPSVGDLITATNFNAWNTVVTNMENVCAHYSRYGSHYGGHYGGNYGSHYSGEYSGFYSGWYGGFYSSHYGSRYGGYYGSHYATRYGAYGSRYGRGGSCLIIGTKILMTNGIEKNIEDVKIGDLVTVFNEQTKTFEKKKVKKFKEHHGNFKVIKVIFTDNSSITLSAGHPILGIIGWQSEDQEESLRVHGVYTKKLKIGDEIIGLNHNLIVKDIEQLDTTKDYDLYNLEIDNIHNFIAGLTDGTEKIITHNAKLTQILKPIPSLKEEEKKE